MVNKITDLDFEQELTNNQNVMVKFYADWCGSCRLFAPKYTKLSNSEGFESIKFLEVNAEENPIARQKAGVNNLPFFATFKNGELVQSDNTTKEENVMKMLSDLIS